MYMLFVHCVFYFVFASVHYAMKGIVMRHNVMEAHIFQMHVAVYVLVYTWDSFLNHLPMGIHIQVHKLVIKVWPGWH